MRGTTFGLGRQISCDGLSLLRNALGRRPSSYRQPYNKSHDPPLHCSVDLTQSSDEVQLPYPESRELSFLASVLPRSPIFPRILLLPLDSMIKGRLGNTKTLNGCERLRCILAMCSQCFYHFGAPHFDRRRGNSCELKTVKKTALVLRCMLVFIPCILKYGRRDSPLFTGFFLVLY